MKINNRIVNRSRGIGISAWGKTLRSVNRIVRARALSPLLPGSSLCGPLCPPIRVEFGQVKVPGAVLWAKIDKSIKMAARLPIQLFKGTKQAIWELVEFKSRATPERNRMSQRSGLAVPMIQRALTTNFWEVRQRAASIRLSTWGPMGRRGRVWCGHSSRNLVTGNGSKWDGFRKEWAGRIRSLTVICQTVNSRLNLKLKGSLLKWIP